MVTVRPARREEADAIQRLVRSSGINPFGLHWPRFVVAVSETGEVIACGQVKPHRDGSRELASIAVAPTCRGQGTARLVIERLLALHPGTLYLTCRASLGPFYARFGFRTAPIYEVPGYYRAAARFIGLLHALRISPEKLLVMVRTG